MIILLGPTNRPWDLESRKQLPEINLKEVQIHTDVDLNFITEKLNGYLGSDITNVCRLV